MRKLLVFLLLAMIAAKVALVILRGPVPLELDALGYWRLSTLAMQGDVLMLGDPIAYRTPIYPWFIAAIRMLAGPYSLWTLSLLQGGLAIASVFIASRIAVRISSLPLAMPCTLVVALPAISSMTFCAAALSETLFVFMLMLHLLAVLSYCKRATAGRAAWTGITFGLALMTRPIVLLLWVAHLVLLLAIHLQNAWSKRRAIPHVGAGPHVGARTPGGIGPPIRLGTRAAHAILAAVLVGAICAPWLLRNAYLFGQPMLTEFVGRNVWTVTFQDGSGSAFELPNSDASDALQLRLDRVGASDQWQSTWGVSNALVRSGLSDPDADMMMKQVALDAIATDPNRFLWKAFRRTANFWRCAATDLPEQGGAEGPFLGQVSWKQSRPAVEWLIEHRWSQSVIGNTLLLGALACALTVLLVNPSTRVYGLWLALILAYFCTVTGILEIPAYRYRMVTEPIVSLTIGAAAAVLLSRRRREAKFVTAT